MASAKTAHLQSMYWDRFLDHACFARIKSEWSAGSEKVGEGMERFEKGLLLKLFVDCCLGHCDFFS